MRLGRRFIGADINLGAIQTTVKRLIGAAEDLRQKPLEDDAKHFTGFELHNVNHYDIFRNPVQAKELLVEALEVQKLEFSTVFDGEKDGRMVKIMPVNRIATRADLNELIAGFDYKAWERKQNESPNRRPPSTGCLERLAKRCRPGAGSPRSVGRYRPVQRCRVGALQRPR